MFSTATSSMEKRLQHAGALLSILVTVLLWLSLYLAQASTLLILTVMLLVLLPFALYLSQLYRRLTDPFYRLTSQVEAIRLEDYSLRMRSQFKKGIARDLCEEINSLSADLQRRKSRYDQHVFLIYQLIEQLDTPILVFDPKGRLSHANGAFSRWLKQPWRNIKGAPSTALGLTQTQAGWQLADPQQRSRWQLRNSHFHQSGGLFQLLILTNIEKELNQAEQNAWRRLIRVLSHEIRNSLTPIKSLAQSLAQLPSQEDKSIQALNVIKERSQSLQDFVERYATLSRQVVLNRENVTVDKLVAKIKGLNPSLNLQTSISLQYVWADPALLEQVMINLVKNAEEAGKAGQPVRLTFALYDGQQRIRVIDQGRGIQNPENLFVPFYTTKKDGQGIGLAFCRNVIDQHGGRLTLTNNQNGPGACAEISLPAPAQIKS